jgi:predicted PurR-regulated permease PerM
MVNKHRSEILFVFAILLGLAIAFVARKVLLLIYVSALLAVVVMPLIERVQRLRLGRWHPGRGTAVAIIVGTGLAISTLFIFFAIPPIVHDLQTMTNDFPARVDKVVARMQHFPLVQDMNPDLLREYATQIAARIIRFVPNLAGTIVTFLSFVILMVYFIIDGERAADWMILLLPTEAGQRLKGALWHARARVQKWMAGQLLLMLILGTLSAIVYGLLGIRYFTLLAAFTGLANIVPVVGPLASVGLATAVAAIDSWPKALGVLIFYALYQQLENAYLTPRIMNATVGLAPLAVVVALLLGGELAGFLGALVAVPSAALVAVIADEYLVKPHSAGA